MNADTFDQSKNDKNVKTSPESPSGNGSSKHSHSKYEEIDGNRSSTNPVGQIDLIVRGESNVPKTHANNGNESIWWEPIRGLSSSSFSSSVLSLDDVFEVETISFESKSFRPASKNEHNDVSSHSSSSSSEVDNNYSVLSSACVPAPTVSPPVQVMESSGGYDPNRIPSSIFGRNNTSPMEWSNVSNDSLFSLNLGNHSFSRDHFMLDDLCKSGELTRSGELRSQASFVIPEDREFEKEAVDKEGLQIIKMLDKTFESENRSNEEENKAKSFHPDLRKSRNFSGRSHCSGASTSSFAFPILTEGDEVDAHKAYVSRRHSEEPYVPTKSASKLAPLWTAKNWNCFWCFSWSSCWTRGKCCRCC